MSEANLQEPAKTKKQLQTPAARRSLSSSASSDGDRSFYESWEENLKSFKIVVRLDGYRVCVRNTSEGNHSPSGSGDQIVPDLSTTSSLSTLSSSCQSVNLDFPKGTPRFPSLLSGPTADGLGCDRPIVGSYRPMLGFTHGKSSTVSLEGEDYVSVIVRHAKNHRGTLVLGRLIPL